MMALEGIKVLDISRAQMGPYAGVLLADFGADVVKVEQLTGDLSRGANLVLYPSGTIDAYVLAHNRGKRGLAVDFRKKEGIDVILKLAGTSDVFIQNFRPGVAEKMGLGYSVLSKLNPRIVYCNLSGFGRSSPLASWPAFDLIGQAMGGIASMTGGPEAGPTPAGTPIADQVGAIYTAYGILMALLARERTGVGQEVDVAMLDCQLALQTWEITHYLVTGKLPPRRKASSGLPSSVWPLWRIFKTRDGHIALAGVQQPRWANFCEAMGMQHIADDPRFNTPEARDVNRDQLLPLFEKRFEQKTTQEWLELLRQADQLVGPVYNYQEVTAHPHVAANHMLLSISHRLGRVVKTVGNPVKLSKTPAQVRSGDPDIGQHTEEVLTELGYSWDEIRGLKEKKVIL